jgi:lambda family phage tail tape measure protein
MPAATETRRITINVDAGQTTAQLKSIADQLGGMNKNTKSLADSFSFLKTIAGTFLGGLGIQQLISFSDQIQTLNNRLLALTGDQETATDLLHKLQQAARDTNSSLADTSELFTRMSLALKDANIDSGVMIELTKTLVNTFRLSGSSAEEAANKVTSLAYAMQQGGLRGRELRTILRENTELGNLLKAAFGGNLLQAANNGFITTAKLMQILHDNMDSVNSRAGQLGATIGQTLTKVLDTFKVKVFEVNQALGISGGFSTAIDAMIKNMGTAITVGAVLAASTLPAIISGVVKLTAALTTLTISSAAILTGGLAVGLGLVVAAFGNSSDIGDILNQLQVGFARLEGIVDNVIGRFYELVVSFKILIGDTAEGFDKQAAASRQAAKDANAHAQALEIEHDALKAYNEQQEKAAAGAGKWKSALDGANKIKFDETPFQMLAKLNAEFESGRISISQYNQKIQQVDLEKMRKEFDTGHADLEKMNQAMDKFSTYLLNTRLRDGQTSFEEFDTAIRNIQLEKLNRDLNSGAISLEEYNSKLAAVSDKFSTNGAFRTGLQDYLTAIGTTTQQVAGAITTAFKNVEDSFISFIKTGTFNFAKFTQDILDDLLRIIIRATIIAPLARGILSGITPTGTPAGTGVQASNVDYSNVAAHGAMFDGNVAKFATGGIVGAPTLFGYSGGKTGLMGEKGPEAILPLARGNGGDLGVKASVTPISINIINNNGSDVSQTESTGPNGDKQIDIMITNKVRESIGSGKFDKAFKQSYGLNRRGS